MKKLASIGFLAAAAAALAFAAYAGCTNGVCN